MQNHDVMLTPPQLSIKDGWKQLNANSHKIVFVVDDGKKLLGSVTDGDIRRWILADGSLHEPLAIIMNANPVYVYDTDTEETIGSMMLKYQIECVPVVDREQRVKRFSSWREIFGKQHAPVVHEKIDVPVVIMAGGRGVRLDPLTKILPKPLVPLGDKPVLEVIVEKFRQYAVDQFYFSVNYRASMIKAYFDEVAQDYSLHYIEEAVPSGTAGSLRLLRGKINTTFIISNCDIIIEADYSDILKFHRVNKNAITIVASMRHFPIPYGVIEMESGGILKGVREKPEFDFLVNTGLYVMEPELLQMIPTDRVYHMTHLIEHLRLENEKIGVYPISQTSWIDIGETVEYKRALSKFE